MSATQPPLPLGRQVRNVLASWPVWVLHGLAISTPWMAPPTTGRVVLAVVVYVCGMIAVTAGYHRYFSHRSFKTSRAFQLVLAWLAQTMLQQGVLWWASTHRTHHTFSDAPGDPHSPVVGGLFWAHMGWTLDAGHNVRHDERIGDLLVYPELRFLDRAWLLPPAVYISILAVAGGLPAVLWGFLLPVVISWHVTYTINSLCHVWGSRPHPTRDGSRNNLLLALLTMGEGWHNNHHWSPRTARQGLEWWQVDVTFYVLRVLEILGIVWDLRPPRRVDMGRPGRGGGR